MIIYLSPDFSIAGVPGDTPTSSLTVKELLYSGKIEDLIGNPQKKDSLIRDGASEQSVVSKTQPHPEECFAVENEADSFLKKIKLPQCVARCGRPKGATRTTIGLPKKLQQHSSNVPVPFVKLELAKRHAS
ncbi:uncharacterized protein LOC136081096 [Hydra vulgaris]|uniref:Uncharacterized protein LOC136081096 n=1 Tax=Hydra vulgaris TaxID=6087 RepID=A0ABM4BYY3_HYDVU